MHAKKICITVFVLQFFYSMLLDAVEGDLSSRQMYLKQILSALPPERPKRGRGVFAASRTARGRKILCLLVALTAYR